MISSVMSNRDAWPFKEPVDEKQAPMYYQVIEEPMHLKLIEQKIYERSYISFNEIEHDFKLLVNNCETFNGPNNGYTRMAYGVWKQFKKATKRFLNRDLEEDEQTVFMYPPKPKVNLGVPTAAIEARKRKLINKNQKGMKALEVLAAAAELAVKDTSSRSSLASSSPRSVASVLEDGDNDFVIYNEVDKNHKSTTGPVSGEGLARYLYNAAEAYTPKMAGFYFASNDNLTFKSLAEWSDSLKHNGNNTILPQHAVVLNSPLNGDCLNNDDAGFMTLQVMSSSDKSEPGGSSSRSHNRNTHTTNFDPNEAKRLVIKLSRCSDPTGTTWKPVHIVTSSSASKPHTNRVVNEISTRFSNTLANNADESEQISNSNGPVKKRNFPFLAHEDGDSNFVVNDADTNGNEDVNEKLSRINIKHENVALQSIPSNFSTGNAQNLYLRCRTNFFSCM